IAGLLQRRAHVVDHRIGHIARDRRADQTAHGNDDDLVVSSACASLKQDLAETRERFDFPPPAIALKHCRRQDEVHEETGAKRDEQKNTETTEPAICCHGGTKLPENRRSHKRFSRLWRWGVDRQVWKLRS